MSAPQPAGEKARPARACGGSCRGVALDAQALEGEGRPRAVSQQPLSAGAGAVDPDGGVQAEAATGLPGEHVGGGVVVEQAAALQCALEAVDVVGRDVRRLVEGDLPSSPSAKRPSRTTTWKWKWGLRAEPKRWRKETAPNCALPGAPGLARCNAVRMARSRMRSTAPTSCGSWGRKGRIRFGECASVADVPRYQTRIHRLPSAVQPA